MACVSEGTVTVNLNLSVLFSNADLTVPATVGMLIAAVLNEAGCGSILNVLYPGSKGSTPHKY